VNCCPECDFADDTMMTVAVADAILNGRSFGETLHEYGCKYPNRGYGGRFYNWLAGAKMGP
jgi:ADP-ribosylglycohydrolase